MQHSNLWFAIGEAARLSAWFLLAFAAVLGILAILNPSGFKSVAQRASVWVDVSDWVRRMDKRVDVDSYFLRHPRVLGIILVLSIAVIGFALRQQLFAG